MQLMKEGDKVSRTGGASKPDGFDVARVLCTTTVHLLISMRWHFVLQWELFLPSELGYGNRNRGKFIKAGDVLIFTLEMIKVNGPSKEIA